MTAPDVVVIGSFVVDVTVRLPRMPVLGETMVGDRFDLSPGGKGTNVAIAARRQGLQVLLVARVGDDQFADLAFELYAREGIDTRYVWRTPNEATAVSLVYLQRSGENTIGLYRGANWRLTPDDISQARHEIAGARVLVTQLEIPDQTVEAAVATGRQAGAQVILNPAPARPLRQELLAGVDVLTPNEGEARLLIGLRPDDPSVGTADVGRRLLELGPRAVIITLGARGCLLIEPKAEPLFLPAYPVEAIDTVGAGDAFTGGLAVACARGKPLFQAACWATVTAALATTGLGAIPPLPQQELVARYAGS